MPEVNVVEHSFCPDCGQESCLITQWEDGMETQECYACGFFDATPPEEPDDAPEE